MRLFLVASNTVAALFSLFWLWGHSTVRSGAWEFWFALGFLALATVNLAYLVHRGRRRYGRESEPPLR